MKNLKNLISFGNYNTYYKFILYAILFKSLYSIIFGVQIGYCTEELRIFPETPLSVHGLVHDVFNYLGVFIIACIISIIVHKKKQKIKRLSEGEKIQSHQRIKLIHIEKDIQKIRKCTIFKIFLISLLWIFHEQSEKIFYFYQLTDLDYWTFEMLILSIIINKMFGINVYKHQKFAMYLILIFGSINKFISFLISFILDDQEILYIQKKYLIPIGIIAFLFIIFLRSYVNCRIKWLMDLKYISITKLLLFYGLSGTILTSIFCIIVTFNHCISDTCTIQYEGKPEKYYDNFIIYFTKFITLSKLDIFIEICYILLSIFLNYCCMLTNLLVIKYLTPIHTICTGAIYYIFMQIILICVTKIKTGNFFKPNDKYKKKEKYFLDLSSDIISFFTTTVYLELIEFNFWGCNYNLRKTIMERSELERTNVNGSEDNQLFKDDSFWDETIELYDYSYKSSESVEF